jgi:hypothetical protein
MLLEDFPVHPRFIIKAFQVGFGDKLYQVMVACVIFGKQNQVVAFFVIGGLAETAAGSYVSLAADNRFYTGLFGSPVELDGPVHYTVVGKSQRIHSQFFGAGDQLGNPAHGIQQAVFAMNVKMGKQA